MTIPKDVYPSNYEGEIGTVQCCDCGIKMCLDTEATQDDWNNEIYCRECHKQLLEDRQEAENELIEDMLEKEMLENKNK